jgi:hypothetical protein
MAGDVDLGHDVDAEILREVDNVAHRVLCVIAPAPLRPRAEQRRDGKPVAAPRGDLGQLREGVDLDAPGFVVAQVPVKDVELVPGQHGEELLDLLA